MNKSNDEVTRATEALKDCMLAGHATAFNVPAEYATTITERRQIRDWTPSGLPRYWRAHLDTIKIEIKCGCAMCEVEWFRGYKYGKADFAHASITYGMHGTTVFPEKYSKHVLL